MPPQGSTQHVPDTRPPTYAMFPQQQAFVEDLSTFCVAVTGIGGAKTKSAAIKMAYALDAYPGLKILATAPSFVQLREGIVQSFLEVCDPRRLVRGGHNQTEHIIRHVNGGQVIYHSAHNPDRFRAFEVGMLVMDEAAYCPRDAHRVGVGRVRQPGTRPQYIYITSPAGLNWVYERFDENPGVARTVTRTGEHSSITRFADGTSVHTWRSMDNPYLPPEAIREWEREYAGTDLYAQDLLGQFMRFRGLVYQPPRTAFIDYVPRGPFRRAFGGVDFGSSTNPWAHATAAVVVVEDMAGRFFVVDELYQRPLRPYVLEEWLAEAQATWDVDGWWGDRSQGQALMMLRQGGIRIGPQPAPGGEYGLPVLQGITIVQNRFATGGLAIVRPNCPHLCQEIRSYQWKEPRPGMPALREPVKMGDDVLDALRYAVTLGHREYNAPGAFDRVILELESGGPGDPWAWRRDHGHARP